MVQVFLEQKKQIIRNARFICGSGSVNRENPYCGFVIKVMEEAGIITLLFVVVMMIFFIAYAFRMAYKDKVALKKSRSR